MEVADQIVVMNHGRVEQTAGARELYDEPANEFVMSFIGPVNRLDDDWIRPHDLELTRESNGATRAARVERVVHLGFEARVELALDDGVELWAQMTQEQCEELELEPGARVQVRPRRARTFVGDTSGV